MAARDSRLYPGSSGAALSVAYPCVSSPPAAINPLATIVATERRVMFPLSFASLLRLGAGGDVGFSSPGRLVEGCSGGDAWCRVPRVRLLTAIAATLGCMAASAFAQPPASPQ